MTRQQELEFLLLPIQNLLEPVENTFRNLSSKNPMKQGWERGELLSKGRQTP